MLFFVDMYLFEDGMGFLIFLGNLCQVFVQMFVYLVFGGGDEVQVDLVVDQFGGGIDVEGQVVEDWIEYVGMVV